MANGTSLDGVRREEWETLTRSVNAGFLQRWDLHDPGGPARAGSRESRMSRLSREPTQSRRPKQAAAH